MEAMFCASVIMTFSKPSLFRKSSEIIFSDRSDGVSSPVTAGTLRCETITKAAPLSMPEANGSRSQLSSSSSVLFRTDVP